MPSRDDVGKPLDISRQVDSQLCGYAAISADHHHPGAQPAGFCRSAPRCFVVNLGETFDLVNIKYPVTELAPHECAPTAPNSLAAST